MATVRALKKRVKNSDLDTRDRVYALVRLWQNKWMSMKTYVDHLETILDEVPDDAEWEED